MDNYYDKKAASTLLASISAERAECCPEYLKIEKYNKEDGVARLARIIEVSRPRCWKLATSPNEQGEQEELVLRMQGIICDRNLPPIKNPQTIALRECKYRRQSLMLTSFCNKDLQPYVEGIQAIFNIFEEVIPSNALEEWGPTVFDGHIAIDMGNRFFTDRRNQSNQEMVPFKPSVDPDGILDRAMGTEFVHLRENEVEYFKCVDDKQGRKTYKVTEPNKLNKGDIVEAQLSFKVVPVKNDMFKPLVVLRAVTLLDNCPTKDALLKRMQKPLIKQTISRPNILKRRVGYMQDEGEDNKERLYKKANME